MGGGLKALRRAPAGAQLFPFMDRTHALCNSCFDQLLPSNGVCWPSHDTRMGFIKVHSMSTEPLFVNQMLPAAVQLGRGYRCGPNGIGFSV